MLWKERWTFVSWANNSVGTQSCPNPPGRSAGRSEPTRPWYVRVLDWTGLHRIAVDRASGETLKLRVFDALEKRRNDCPLGEQLCLLPILRDLAPATRRRASRGDPPVAYAGFGLDMHIMSFAFCIHVIVLVKCT